MSKFFKCIQTIGDEPTKMKSSWKLYSFPWLSIFVFQYWFFVLNMSLNGSDNVDNDDDDVMFAIAFQSQADQLALVDICSNQPRTIAGTITLERPFPFYLWSKQRDNATLHFYQLFDLVMLQSVLTGYHHLNLMSPIHYPDICLLPNTTQCYLIL